MAVRTCGCRYYDTANAYGVHNLSGATRPHFLLCKMCWDGLTWPGSAKIKFRVSHRVGAGVAHQTADTKNGRILLVGLLQFHFAKSQVLPSDTSRLSFSSFLQPKTSRLANALLVKVYYEWSIEILELCLSFYGKMSLSLSNSLSFALIPLVKIGENSKKYIFFNLEVQFHHEGGLS